MAVRSRGIVQLLDHQGNVLGFTRVESIDSGTCILLYETGSCLMALFSDGLLVRLKIEDDLKIESEERLVTGMVHCADFNNGKLVIAGKDVLPTIYREGKLEWQAPKPKPDSLGLPIKVDIRAVRSLDNGIIACGTSKGVIWVYDPSLPNKSCKIQEKILINGGIPITSILSKEKKIFVSGQRGSLESFSFPELKAVGGYGPSADGSIQAFIIGRLVTVSISMDRFIRIHDVTTNGRRKLLQKIFLGHQPTAICMVRDHEVQANNDDDDELWSGLKHVRDRPIV